MSEQDVVVRTQIYIIEHHKYMIQVSRYHRRRAVELPYNVPDEEELGIQNLLEALLIIGFAWDVVKLGELPVSHKLQFLHLDSTNLVEVP